MALRTAPMSKPSTRGVCSSLQADPTERPSPQLWGDVILEHLQNTDRKLRSATLFAMIAPNFIPMTCLGTVKRGIQISTVRTLSLTLLFLASGVAIAQPRSGNWLTVSPSNLCVTECVIDKTSA